MTKHTAAWYRRRSIARGATVVVLTIGLMAVGYAATLSTIYAFDAAHAVVGGR